MDKLAEPVMLHRMRLLRIPNGWEICYQKRFDDCGVVVNMTIDAGDLGIFRVMAASHVYGAVDTSPGRRESKERIKNIEDNCLLPVRECPSGFISYFRKRYPSERSLVTAFSQLQPGAQLPDQEFVNRSQHAALAVAFMHSATFERNIPSKVSHETLDVYAGGGVRRAVAYVFEKNSNEGLVLVVGAKKPDKSLLREELARRLAIVSAVIIDGLPPGL